MKLQYVHCAHGMGDPLWWCDTIEEIHQMFCFTMSRPHTLLFSHSPFAFSQITLNAIALKYRFGNNLFAMVNTTNRSFIDPPSNSCRALTRCYSYAQCSTSSSYTYNALPRSMYAAQLPSASGMNIKHEIKSNVRKIVSYEANGTHMPNIVLRVLSHSDSIRIPIYLPFYCLALYLSSKKQKKSGSFRMFRLKWNLAKNYRSILYLTVNVWNGSYKMSAWNPM